jgi:hypothetical protein
MLKSAELHAAYVIDSGFFIFLFIYFLFIWSIQHGVITQQDIEHVKIA